MTCQRLIISVAQLRIIVISVLLPPAAGNSSSLCFAAAAEGPTIGESSGIEQLQQQQHGALRRRSLLLLGLFAEGSPCAAAAKLSPGSPVATSEVSEVNDLALKAINAYRYCVGERGVGEGGRGGGQCNTSAAVDGRREGRTRRRRWLFIPKTYSRQSSPLHSGLSCGCLLNPHEPSRRNHGRRAAASSGIPR